MYLRGSSVFGLRSTISTDTIRHTIITNHFAVRYMWNKDHWDEFSKTFENLEYFFRSVEDCFVLRAEIEQLRDSMVPVRRLYLAVFDFADEFCY